MGKVESSSGRSADLFYPEGFEKSRRIAFQDGFVEFSGVGRLGVERILSCLNSAAQKSLWKTVISLDDEAKLALSTIKTRVASLSRVLNYFKFDDFSLANVKGINEICNSIKTNYFTGIKCLLLDCHRLECGGVSDEVARYLVNTSLVRGKRPSGSRVRSDDVNEGYYEEVEYDHIVSAIWRDYEAGRVSLWDTCALLLSAQYGRRPIQYAELKNGDFCNSGSSAGVHGPRVSFPKAKGRVGGKFRVAGFEVHPMGDELWKLCKIQRDNSIKQFELALGRPLALHEKDVIPFFYPRRLADLRSRIVKHSGEGLSGRDFHVRSTNMSAVFFRKGRSVYTKVKSVSTGEILVENAYRFRYTRARQLANLGVPRKILQMWLGHGSGEIIDIYYDDPAERARILDEAIRPVVAPLVQAFCGKLVDSEKYAIRGDDPSSRVGVDGREDSNLGSCGSHGFCGALVPVPCYRCKHFQPWVDGPHHEVLKLLKERQDIERSIPLPGQGRRLIAPLQLDKDIEAVNLVVSLCDAKKNRGRSD